MDPGFSTRRVVRISLLVDLVDVVTNLVVLLATGSAVIFAEMALGLADAFGSGLLVVGERRGRLPRDARHPLGYGREMFFWALLSSLVMLIVGGAFPMWRGVQQILAPELLARPSLAIAVLLLSITTNTYAVLLAWRNLAARPGGWRRALRQPSDPLVKTSLLRDVSGVLTSVAGLVALVLYVSIDSLIFDGVGAVVVGAATAAFAIFVIAEVRSLITGRSLPAEVTDRIRSAVASASGVRTIHRLAAVHAGGDEVLVELDLELEDQLETSDIEAALDDVQARVRGVAPTAATIRVDLNSASGPHPPDASPSA